MIRITLLIFSLFTCQIVFGQDMTTGFGYLENGKVSEAEKFFEEILKDYPENKTANICYGRAVGLNGNPEKATALFSQLRDEYPNDLEVELNYAESLLWGKQFEEAKVCYSQLVAQYPENFGALLGYANTFSNMKDYEQAMVYVNKALEVQAGNPNATTSKKYIRLGYAYSLMQNQKYNESVSLLKENLQDFPNDKETLLNLANVYLISKETDLATATYRKLALNYNDSIVALNGMALAAHLAENDKLALELATQAKGLLAPVKDSVLVLATTERYIQALIWNKKYGEADRLITEMLENYGAINVVLSLRATLGMYTSNIKQSISDYQAILENDSTSFDGNLGISNAYFANGEIKKSYKAVRKTLTVFNNQKDAVGFLNKLDKSFTPFVEERLSYSFDNGENTAYTSRTGVVFPVSTQLTILSAFQYRHAQNSSTSQKAVTNNFELGVQYQLHPKVSLNVLGGISSANSFSRNYNQWVANLSFKIRPIRLQDLEIGYKREMQSYNADLIDREIETNHYYLNYNLSTNFRLGWFSQYYYTTQSDNNKRNLLFTSLYYNFLSKPVLKGGVNYQSIGFKNQVPDQYFSPEKFQAVELFVDLLKDEGIAENGSWFYSATAAAGYQFIEQASKQSTYRVQLKLGYKMSDRFLVNAYGMQSNIASSSASGYTYTEFGVRLKWLFLKKPVLRTN